jgi:hypothetical protein
MHAFLFAKLMSLFSFWGDYLTDQTAYWCLMFIFLAIFVFGSYFILGWSSNIVAWVRPLFPVLSLPFPPFALQTPPSLPHQQTISYLPF